ncbi:hypothetical protein Tco_0678371 [Tanacetum coccineum]|uniref:Uncharacterized protein n=1 Tax=Tanacetum coccineum TaxID=301880 RepID=A0ABQ4XG72_9ASTR
MQLIGMWKWGTYAPWHVTLRLEVVPSYGKTMSNTPGTSFSRCDPFFGRVTDGKSRAKAIENQRAISMRYSTHEYWRDPECGPIRGGRLTRASTPIVTYLCTGPYGIGRACTTVCCEEYPEHHDSSEEDMPVEDQPNAEEANSRGFLADSDSMEDDTDTDSIDYHLHSSLTKG